MRIAPISESQVSDCVMRWPSGFYVQDAGSRGEPAFSRSPCCSCYPVSLCLRHLIPTMQFFFIPSSHVEDDSNRYLGFLLDKLALSIYTDAILPFLSCLSLFQTQFAFSRFSDLGNAVDCIKQVNFSTQFLVHRQFKYRVVKVKLMIILIKTPRQLSKIFLYR